MACCTQKPIYWPLSNVLRRQEIDYQFYFILFYQLHFNPPKKEVKKKKKVGFACRPNYTQDKA
jgi:hypothetical protein